MKYFVNNVSPCLVLDCSHVILGAETEKGSKAFQGQIKGFQNLVTAHAIEQNLLCHTSVLHRGMILAIFLVC